MAASNIGAPALSPDSSLIEQRSKSGSHVFVAAWVAYAGFNSCRLAVHWDPFPNGREHTWQAQFADLMVFFSLGYVFGQFVAGWSADRYGPRRTLLFGGLLSALTTVVISFNIPLAVFCVLQMLNGFAQGFGWPAISKLFSAWLARDQWAIGFAWWSTSYVLGSFLFAALSRVSSNISGLPPFLESLVLSLMPACILLLTTCFFYFRVKDSPQDAGFKSDVSAESSKPKSGGWKEILQNRDIRLLAGMYFFLKLTRYSLLFWLPLYLVETVHIGDRASFGLSSLLELAGFLGALIAAYVSELALNGRRYPVGSTMLYLASFLFLLHPMIWPLGRVAIGISIAAIGILVWGPDLLMTSVAVLEAVPIEQVGRASGFVDGVGSVGQVISPLLIMTFVRWFGWNSIFNLFFASSLITASLLARNWDKPGYASPRAATKNA